MEASYHLLERASQVSQVVSLLSMSAGDLRGRSGAQGKNEVPCRLPWRPAGLPSLPFQVAGPKALCAVGPEQGILSV